MIVSRRILRSALVLVALPVSLVMVPLSAEAQTGVTVTIGADSVLLDPTLIRVPVQISCEPMDVRTDMGSTSELRQAVSRLRIAHGTGVRENEVVCDGTVHANSYLFWADPSGPPFGAGTATVSIRVNLCDQSFNCQDGSSGIQVTRVQRDRS